MDKIKFISLTFLSVTFLLLAILHFLWAGGVKWGFEASLPTKTNGERVLNPKRIDCLIVGSGLALFAAFYLAQIFKIQLTPTEGVASVVSWVIPSIFLLRSIGDFKYVGFFKKVNTTRFGHLDSKLIVPMCLFIAALGLLANVL